MVLSVNSAFNQFIANTINIPKAISDKAKASRDFLLQQINYLSNNKDFFKLYNGRNCFFGSFSRKTKICVLDDIDFIVCVDGSDLIVEGNQWDNMNIKLKAQWVNTNFVPYSDRFTSFGGNLYYLNSNRVKNLLLSGLHKIPQYDKAELHSRGEAVTLKLRSYDWNFDIVPAFFCDGDDNAQPYYLIPNGYGKWKKTNPVLEQYRISSVNKKFNGKVLETVRLVKYWNRHGKMPNITSYVLETMVVDCFRQATYSETSNYVDLHFKNILGYIYQHILGPVQDGKGIQGNINNLFYDQKNSIYNRAYNDYLKACEAINAELIEKNMQKSINLWRNIFGWEFPIYG